MNNQILATLLTQYLRALDFALDMVAEKLPEYKVTGESIPGISMTAYTTYPVLDPVYRIYRNLAEDIEKLEKPLLMVEDPYQNLTNRPQPVQDSPRKRKEVITFEQDHICVNGANLGVHDLLMYARACLKKEAGIDAEVARIKVELEDVIEANQRVRGTEDGRRFPHLSGGVEN